MIMINHQKACKEVKIHSYIGGKVEKSLNRDTKGYKRHLRKLVDGLFISVVSTN